MERASSPICFAQHQKVIDWGWGKKKYIARHFLTLCEMEICDFMSFCSVEKRESSKTMTSVSFTESNVTVSSRFWPGAALSSYSQGVFVCRPWTNKGERTMKRSIQNRRETLAGCIATVQKGTFVWGQRCINPTALCLWAPYLFFCSTLAAHVPLFAFPLYCVCLFSSQPLTIP